MFSRVFFKEKPARTLASLLKKDRRWYASMLCKEIDCTYPHMINVLSSFERAGLVETQAQGRVKFVKLTALGEDLAHEFEGLLRKLDRVEVGDAALAAVVSDEFAVDKKERKSEGSLKRVEQAKPARAKRSARKPKKTEKREASSEKQQISVEDEDGSNEEPRVEIPRGYV